MNIESKIFMNFSYFGNANILQPTWVGRPLLKSSNSNSKYLLKGDLEVQTLQ